MSHSQPPHHDDVCKASPSHAPGTTELALYYNREVAALPPPPPPPPPLPKRITWTEEEHRLFLEGISRYGKGSWKKISQNCLKSRTPSQIASHAQKYFLRQGSADRKRKSIHDQTLEIVQSSSPRNTVTMHQHQQDSSSHRHLNLNLNHPVIMPIQQDSTRHDRNQNHSVKRSPQKDSTHDNGNENHSVKRSLQQDSTHDSGNENHSVIRHLQQVPAHDNGNENHSVKRLPQQDSTHDSGNENHSVTRHLQQVPAHDNGNENHSVKRSPQQDSTHDNGNENHSVKRSLQQDSTHDNGNENHSVARPLQQVPAHHSRNISPPPHHLYIDMIIQKSDEGHLDIFVKDSNQVKVQSVITVQASPHHLDLSSQQIHIPDFFSENHPPHKCRVMLKNFGTQP
ncbi:hypothetical protein Lal_00034744 [Lupinus albus]|nr:hypothetical protein Lal_00034744 [Lupinus albus]